MNPSPTTITQQDHHHWLARSLMVVGATAVTALVLWLLTLADVATAGPSTIGPSVAAATPPPEPTPPVDAPLAPVVLRAPGAVVTAELFMTSGSGVLRRDRSGNGVEIFDGISFSPSGQTQLKVGGMPAAFDFERDFVALAVGDAGQAAFAEPFADGGDIYNPGGRATSSIVVVELRKSPQPEQVRRYDFDANIVPEVFTADGTALFVIDHRPALDPTGYSVRLLDLASGELSDITAPQDPGSGVTTAGSRTKHLAPAAMEGTGGQQVGTSSGEYLFTFYSRQPSHHDGSTHTGHVHGFIHALSLTQRWAVCIDLPEGFGLGDPDTGALAVDPADERLFVVDSTARGIVGYEISDLGTSTLGEMGLPQPAARAGLDLTPDAPVNALATANTLWIAQEDRIWALSHDLVLTPTEYRTEAPVETLVVDSSGNAFAVVAQQLVPLPVP